MSDYNDGLLPTPCLRMDTHFGDMYESVEFGDGTGYIKAAPILAKVGALHEEIDALRDEEARLREEIRKHIKMPDEPLAIGEKDFYARAFIKWAIEEQPKVKRLEAENAKLRELVRDMWHDARLLDANHLIGGMRLTDLRKAEYESRMRELGVDI